MNDMTITATRPRSVRDQVSEQEWELRVDLAACYRLMAKFKMIDMIYNHITARVPGPKVEMLINAYGLHYSEITASSLYKIDLDGEIVFKPETHYGINVAGYVIHSAVHEVRHDVGCVIHTHTPAGMAVAAMKCGLLPISQTALRFYDRISYHDYWGPAIDGAEKESLVADLGKTNAMILRNHGLLACGGSIAETFNTIYSLELACQAQVGAMAGGQEIVLPSPEICEKSARLYDPGVRRIMGELEWEAMLRLLDREDPSYKD
jgi:ribulose-5-phosphate 4-epimerase/fuculose-1-phosphate aldolase